MEYEIGRPEKYCLGTIVTVRHVLTAATCFCNDDLKPYHLNGWDTKSKKCGIPTGDGWTARLYKKYKNGETSETVGGRSYKNVKGISKTIDYYYTSFFTYFSST